MVEAVEDKCPLCCVGQTSHRATLIQCEGTDSAPRRRGLPWGGAVAAGPTCRARRAAGTLGRFSPGGPEVGQETRWAFPRRGV